MVLIVTLRKTRAKCNNSLHDSLLRPQKSAAQKELWNEKEPLLTLVNKPSVSDLDFFSDANPLKSNPHLALLLPNTKNLHNDQIEQNKNPTLRNLDIEINEQPPITDPFDKYFNFLNTDENETLIYPGDKEFLF